MVAKKNKKLKWILYGFYLLLFTVVALEIILRIYNPFRVKIRGDKFELITNAEYKLANAECSDLDKTITYKINSLGFRGEEPVANMPDQLSILTIGGSSTASMVLSEGDTWTDLLGKKLGEDFQHVWINNAGFNGYSTYGINNFLQHYVKDLHFRPKMAIFLVGINDVDRDDLQHRDTTEFNRIPRSFKNWLKRNSETVNLISTAKNHFFPHKLFTLKDCWNFEQFAPVTLPPSYIDSALNRQLPLLPSFANRLNKLIDFCQQHGIVPVFISHPLVSREATAAGGNHKIGLHPFRQTENLQLLSLKLDLCNQQLKTVAANRNIFFIDLAAQITAPENFYDFCHFNKKGSNVVADSIHAQLKPYIDKVFPSYKNNLLTK